MTRRSITVRSHDSRAAGSRGAGHRRGWLLAGIGTAGAVVAATNGRDLRRYLRIRRM